MVTSSPETAAAAAVAALVEADLELQVAELQINKLLVGRQISQSGKLLWGLQLRN